MKRLLPLTLIATAALSPAALAASSGGTVHLNGTPTLTRQDATMVAVKFNTDKPLPRRADGKILGSVKVHGGVSSISAATKAGNKYVSYTRIGKMKRGSRLTVVIKIDGQPDIARNVTLR